MAKEMQLKKLIFPLRAGQVFYAEKTKNGKLNSFIRENHDWLKETFKNEGLQFVYMPVAAEEAIRYNAPYYSKEKFELILHEMEIGSYIDDENFPASLAFVASAGNATDKILSFIPIEIHWYNSSKTIFAHLAKEIRVARELQELEDSKRLHDRLRETVRRQKKYSLGTVENETGPYEKFSLPDASCLDYEDIRFSRRIDTTRVTNKEPDADERFEKESQKLVKEVRDKIEALRSMGFDLSLLHNLIDEGEKLSRLVITKDKRILLPDYDNMEIHLSELPKAVFLLFLRHTEGIRFKELPDYRDELLEIYLSLNPRGSKEKNERSICDITDPLKNSINEKCARIREAFVKEFDDRLAKHYYIRGKQGEAKRIELDAELIEWE